MRPCLPPPPEYRLLSFSPLPCTGGSCRLAAWALDLWIRDAPRFCVCVCARGQSAMPVWPQPLVKVRADLGPGRNQGSGCAQKENWDPCVPCSNLSPKNRLGLSLFTPGAQSGCPSAWPPCPLSARPGEKAEAGGRPGLGDLPPPRALLGRAPELAGSVWVCMCQTVNEFGQPAPTTASRACSFQG